MAFDRQRVSLLLLSFKGSNPVWRATGHNEPFDGRVHTWTRHVSDQLSASEHRQDMFTVCESIGLDQPIEVGEGAVSERLPSFDGFTLWRHVTLMSPQQAVDSRTDRDERGLSETPILWISFLCIQSDRPT